MPENVTEFLSGRLDAYARSCGAGVAAEGVDLPMLEARIKVATALFGAIRDLDERVAREIVAGTRRADRAVGEEIRALYAAWERSTREVVPQLKALRAQGELVDGGEAYAAAVLDARSTLRLWLDELDESARQLREGNRRTMAEVVDGVRRRLGA